jgi:hypothetical protein
MAGIEGSLAEATDAPPPQVAGARRGLATGAAIAALWLVAASRWIVTDTVVPWNSKNQFYAFFRFLAASIHAGVSPFWNPYQMGIPFTHVASRAGLDRWRQ